MTDQGRRGLFNVSATLVGQGAGLLVMALGAVVLPRLMGPEDYGRLAATLAVISILFVVSRLGIPAVEIRFLPPLLSSGESRALADLASSLWSLGLLTSTVSALICALWIELSLGELAPGVALFAGLFALARYGFQATRSLLLPLRRAGRHASIEAVQVAAYLAAMVGGYLLSGLRGAFACAALVNVGLLLVARSMVAKRLVRFSIGFFARRRLRSLLGYNLAASLGAIAGALTEWLPVWMVAVLAGAHEAAYVGLAFQALALMMGLTGTARYSLVPILVELEEGGEEERLFLWLSWILRVGVAVVSVAAVLWALLGREILSIALGADYALVFGPVAVILVGALARLSGSVANDLHLIRKRAGTAALNLTFLAVAVVVGVGSSFIGDPPSVALRATVGYAVAAVLFSALAHWTVCRVERLRLPLGRMLGLVLPVAVAWPAAVWQGGGGLRYGAALLFLALYAVWTFGFGLLTVDELSYIKKIVRRGPAAGHDSQTIDDWSEKADR